MGGTGTAATSGGGGGGGDGHESDEEGEEAVWPGEHTWAILTRVCFTLGNLTTTNAENRYDNSAGSSGTCACWETKVKDLELINMGNLCVLHRQLIGQKLGLADHLVMLLQVMQQYIVLCAVL